MSRLSAALLIVLAAACGSSSPPPTAPSPVTQAPVTPPPPPPPVILTGRVVASVTGEALGDLSLDLSGAKTSTDADGRFRYELPPGGSYPRLTIGGPNIVQRSMSLTLLGSRDLTVDVISLNSGFDLDYYRRLVRDDYDSPGLLRSLRRWTQAPRLYLKTIDEAGAPVDADTLEHVAAAFEDDAAAWTGGRFGLAGIDRGTETREGVSGWITVKWPIDGDETLCGRAQVAADGGWIELYSRNRDCACVGSRISPGVVRHELGHALGFYHTGERDDVMYPFAQCDRHPSARERLHAAIAYSRPFGNMDLDDDPFSLFQRLKAGAPIVVN